MDVALIIPVQNDKKNLKKLLLTVNDQSCRPSEIVIVDSSTDDEVKGFVEQHSDTLSINYHYEKKAYPGRARNIGANLASGEWIAFLDCKTVPDREWLERYQHLAEAYHADAVFGVTQFDATTPFQEAFRAATYGRIGHQTVPGTLIQRRVFTDSGGFLEHVRMGEDIEWRERLTKKDVNIHRPEKPIVYYIGLPVNFSNTLKKYLISAYHTARLNILRNVKDAYLTLLLILSTIILPKWNYLIGDWDNNPLFIHHVTKIYLIALVSLFLAYQLVHYLFFRNTPQTLFSGTLRVILILFLTLAVLNWNAVIAGWVEDAVLYVPHITKMYVGGVLLTSILYRGIFLPLKRKVEPGYLFPFRWIQVGLLGLSLDLVKAPGYVVGAVIGLLKRFKFLE